MTLSQILKKKRIRSLEKLNKRRRKLIKKIEEEIKKTENDIRDSKKR